MSCALLSKISYTAKNIAAAAVNVSAAAATPPLRTLPVVNSRRGITYVSECCGSITQRESVHAVDADSNKDR